MTDLTAAIILHLFLCGLSIRAGAVLSRYRSSLRFPLVISTTVLLMVAYLTLLWNRPVMSRLVPGSGLIILANWLPLWACFFVGIYLRSQEVGMARRAIVCVTCIVLCIYSTVAPVTGRSPVCGRPLLTSSGLHYQSTPYTCSAACGASLLTLHGITATEEEMARMSLTRRGTHWMGLFRALKLKTAGTAWDVVVEPFDPENISYACSTSPCVLCLDIDTSSFPRGVDHGFQSSVGHSVVLLARHHDSVITVFDPSPDYGIEEWDHRVLGCVEGGVALRLVPAEANAKVTRQFQSQHQTDRWAAGTRVTSQSRKI